MELTGYVVAALVIFYLVWIFKLASALRNANIDLPSAIPDISVSIVVAMRNEQEHILNLLNALRAQKNPPLQTELILIDDFSTDNTIQQIESWKINNSDFNIRVIAMSDFPNAGKGKKDAILLGVNSAMHDYIITTDADCTMQANWLNAMCNYFISARPALLAGPVMLHAVTLFGKLQQMEMILLQALTCATFKLNKPVMCNAANMMFRKMDYLSLNKNALNTKTASGDDIFLMLALKQKGLKMDYCCCQQCVVKQMR
ncbi:MAG: glycosyltransferase [Bacteroidetes bacterium]|nr:glycosyltransferase [Bacteroidota bacterium]